MDSFLYPATLFLIAMVAAVPVAARLGLGSVLGYLLAGMVIGPFLSPAPGGMEELRHVAEFGVVMMLFLIGLELEPRALWAMRDKLLGLGSLQIVLTAGAIAAGAVALGQSWPVAVTLGVALSLSSTAIVLQTLTERKLMQTAGGRSTFAVLLAQDIAVIPMLALLPLLALVPAEAHTDGRGLIDGLPGWGVTLVTLAAVGAVVAGGHFLIRPLYRYVAASRLREINTALALLIVVGIALLMQTVGLSPALGTFLAGVVLANSEFRHEMESDIQPFKGLLLGLFFITVGAGIDLQKVLATPLYLLGLTAAVMAVKGVVLFGLGRAFGLRRRDLWLFTLGLAQAGEFGFVLVSFAVAQDILPGGTGQTVLIVVALSMLLTPLAFILYSWLAARQKEETAQRPHDAIDEQQPIIIAGVGRFGQVVNRMITTSGFKTTVIDHSIETIELMRKFGFKGYYGDPTRPEILTAAGVGQANILVVCLDDAKATLRLVVTARRLNPKVHIIARARDRGHVFELYQAGADQIVRELFDSSLRAARYALETIGLSEFEAAEVQRTYYQLDRQGLLELAALWKPGVLIAQNAEYIARARELDRELETALLARFARSEDKAAE